MAVLATAVGGGAVYAATSLGGDDGEVAAPSGSVEDRTVSADPDELASAGFRELPDAPTEIPDAPATDALGAVTGFLIAEANDDYVASFDFLSTDEQISYGTPAGWVSAHADVMPPITAFEVGEVVDGPDGTQVTSTVGFRPSLDEVIGLVPAQAEVSWAVTEQDGAVGVSLEGSSLEPAWLDDAGVPEAARNWVASRQACEPTGEWGGTLLGVQGPARELCDATGPVEVGDEVTTLGQLDATPFVTAFGGDAVGWARVVAVSSPVELRVVLAPIGAEWRVIGALPADGIESLN